MKVLSRLLALLGLAALLTMVPSTIVISVHAGDRAGAHGDRAHNYGTTSWGKDVAFRVTDQLSAQTQAALFPRRDVAFSVTHRLWAGAPGPGGEAGQQELARLHLSQRIDLSGRQEHAFQRLAPGPLWADLLLEARVAPVSKLSLSTMTAYNPAAAHRARATAELTWQPLTFWTLSLAPDFGDGSKLELLNGGTQLTLPGAWTVSYGIHFPALDAAMASQTVTARYRSSYGNVRLQLAQSPEESRVGVLVDVATLLRRTLGF